MQGLVLDVVYSLTCLLCVRQHPCAREGAIRSFIWTEITPLDTNSIKTGFGGRSGEPSSGSRAGGLRVESAESRGGRLGTQLYHAAPCVRKRVAQLPLEFDLVRERWLFQPPSTTVERVFSVMNNVFGAQQITVLNDLFELTVNVAPQPWNSAQCQDGCFGSDHVGCHRRRRGEATGGSLLALEKSSFLCTNMPICFCLFGFPIF